MLGFRFTARHARMSGGPGPEPLSELIAQVALSADRTAFARLFGYFAPRVKSYMIRMGAEPLLAEELAQETLLVVWRKAAAFDPEKAAPSTWVFRIARNLRIDQTRRGLRQGEAAPPDVASPEPGPDDALLTQQSQLRVRAALGGLPAEQAEVVRLAYFSEKPHSEIAEDLRLPLGTVKSRLRLAMARLRAALEDLQ